MRAMYCLYNHSMVVMKRIEKKKRKIEHHPNYNRKRVAIAAVVPGICYTSSAVLRPPDAQPPLLS